MSFKFFSPLFVFLFSLSLASQSYAVECNEVYVQTTYNLFLRYKIVRVHDHWLTKFPHSQYGSSGYFANLLFTDSNKTKRPTKEDIISAADNKNISFYYCE